MSQFIHTQSTPDEVVPHKRRNYLINPNFQLRFILYVAFAILFSLFLVYVSNLWYFETIIAQGQEIGLDPAHPYYEFIEQQRTLLTRTYFTVSGIVFIAVMVMGVLLSHHIAGPLYCIKKHIIQVTEGKTDLEPVKLRDGDFFVDLADSLNEMLDSRGFHEKANNRDPE